MKKVLSVFLCAVLFFSLCLPISVSALQPIEPSEINSTPNILVGGDGNGIYDADGNRIYRPSELISSAFGNHSDDDEDDDNLKTSVMNVLKPFILGVATGNYDAYYEKLQFEVGELTEKLQMDENGDPKYGTDIHPADRATNTRKMTTPNAAAQFRYNDYEFWYDWRKSPLEIVDELDAYIEAVCAMTGHDQVTLTGRCLGSNFVLAYLAKYGDKHRIKGIGFDCGMMYGQDALGEAISGKFKTDGDAINRYLVDMAAYEGFELDSWITDLIDFAEHAELLHGLSIVTKATIYDQVVEGVSSALALSTQCMIPAYWSCVSLKDYDAAMRYVFGPVGSEKREKYAGLIEKIEAYHNEVQVNIDTILSDFAANGGNVCVISKYGKQMTPLCESRNLVADDMVSVHNSTMGSTTSMLYNTLPDDYIALRETEGKGKYISPDRQVDVSTALFPDSTWLIKGIAHGEWTSYEQGILYTVMAADRQLTIDDLTVPRFAVRDATTGAFVPMTADNCRTESWTPETPKEEQTKVNRVFRFLQSLFTMFKHLFNLLKDKFGA